MKKLLFLILVLGTGQAFCQANQQVIFDSIPYFIVRISSEIDFEKSEMTPSKYIVWLDISEESFAQFKTRSNSSWLELLADNETFFDTNLMLYALLEMDAEILTVLEPSQWENYFKTEEVDYWGMVLEEAD